ncbi:MAG: D-alanine--D-alanine ligase [Lachnospira sp.]|nr:D-alanine--D-alanine ligase [Lachnospira sp.]
MKIAVLAAGTSTERDVSVSTSRNVCASLRRNGHKANMIDAFFGTDVYKDTDAFFEDDSDLEALSSQMLEKTKDVPAEIRRRKAAGEGFFGPSVIEVCRAADIVFIGLHGANGEDGKVQGAFDLLGIRYTGTDSLSSAISMNKDYTKKILRASGVRMPDGITLHRADDRQDTIAHFPVPCVVKPACGGSSVGVTIVKERGELEKALAAAFALEDTVLVEQFISGREFSTGVLAGKAMPVVQIEAAPGGYNYENKYKAGGAIETCPAPVDQQTTEKLQKAAEDACRACGVTPIGRVDEILSDDGLVYCLEINTLPGMTETSLVPKEAKAMGMSYDDLTEKMIELSLAKYRD